MKIARRNRLSINMRIPERNWKSGDAVSGGLSKREAAGERLRGLG